MLKSGSMQPNSFIRYHGKARGAIRCKVTVRRTRPTHRKFTLPNTVYFQSRNDAFLSPTECYINVAMSVNVTLRDDMLRLRVQTSLENCQQINNLRETVTW